MALYQIYNWSNGTTYLADLQSFAEANGWTASLSNAGKTCTIAKGGESYEFKWSSGTTITLGSGSSGSLSLSYSSPGQYMFISCGSSLFVGSASSSWGWRYGGVCRISAKTGVWSGGTAIIRHTTAAAFESCLVKIDNEWTPSSGAGSVSAGLSSPLLDYQPFHYNAGIMPMPVMMYRAWPTTSQKQPLGYIDGVYGISCGNIYRSFDEIIIGGKPYLVIAGGYMFKLEV